MSTTTAPPPTARRGRVPVVRPHLGTLVAVELRKLVDTRSGRGLLAALLGLAVGLLALKLADPGAVAGGTTFENTTMAVTPSVSYVLPIVALVAMTSEWTQRTALTTFTLCPRRGRVLAAKFTAALVLSLGVFAVTTLLAVGGTALGGVLSGDGASFADAGGVVRTTFVAALLQVVTGAAYGALVPNTAVAMAAFLGLPLAWGTVSPSLPVELTGWLDLVAAYDRLGSATPGADLAQTLVAIGLWVMLPAVVGVHRSLRREVR